MKLEAITRSQLNPGYIVWTISELIMFWMGTLVLRPLEQGCVELKISPAWNIVNVIVKSKGSRYQLDRDAFRSRYGLCLGIQGDQHLHTLSGSVLSVQFSKSTLELQLNTLDIMEVAYRPKPKHESFKKNFQKRNLPVVTKISGVGPTGISADLCLHSTHCQISKSIDSLILSQFLKVLT